MIDLTPILAVLGGLGPWGIAIGVGLTFLVQYLRNRNGSPLVTPTPEPTPKPDGTPGTPLLDALLNLLKLKLIKKATDVPQVTTTVVTSPDIDDDTFEKLLKALAPK